MITVRDLHKSFGSKKALDGLSLEVQPGRIFGLIGPNGAGKTTTIRILAGLLRPDRGETRLNGAGPDQPLNLRRTTGALIEQPGLYHRLTLLEYLTFFARLYDLGREQTRGRIRFLLALLELETHRDEKLQGFSLGMKQKVALARILLHDPPILLLDEPTAGLDPLISKKVRDYLLGGGDRCRKTVLVSTHHLDEASRVCDEIAILHQGRLLERGTWEELRLRHTGQGRVSIRLIELREEYARVLEGTQGLRDLQIDLARQTLTYLTDDTARTNPEVVSRLAGAGAPVLSVTVDGGTLEEAYLKLIGSRG